MENFVKNMSLRGLLKQANLETELRDHVTQRRVAYVGFDPTASSLHVGHLLPVMMLSRWQKTGHKAIAVMGGGTALIGDPTGKSAMRQFLTPEEIDKNIAGFKVQVSGLLDFSSPAEGEIVNNADWLLKLNYVEFLRDYGKHFSVNRMLTADCFKTRLETGLSFLEFNYMLLQAYDFLHLFQTRNCTVQLGGDDQWSNMLAGTDLIRRITQKDSYCMTNPLLTTSDGKKMGKTEKGAVWLDPNLTSPFEYFQFWRNITDDKVMDCLRFFTFIDSNTLDDLAKLQGSEINQAKETLAREATALVHGEEEADSCLRQAHSQFTANKAGGSIEATELKILIPDGASTDPVNLIVGDIMVWSGAVPSKGEAKRLIKGGGVTLDDEKIGDPNQTVALEKLRAESGVLLKLGKKLFYRLKL